MRNPFARFWWGVIGCCSLFSTTHAQEPLPFITVSGSAEIRVVPDEVVITAAVESRHGELSAAVNDNDEKIRQVVQFLTESGVPNQHIRTEMLRIQPIMPRDPNPKQMAQSGPLPQSEGAVDGGSLLTPVGYSVTRQFAITITQLDQFEAIYRGLLERGINNVSGVEFRTSQLRTHRDEARLQAVRAAREKATALAGELGATLSGIKSIEESVDGGYFGRNMMQNVVSSAAGDATFAAGQIEITASVNVVFYLGHASFEK